MRQMLLLLIVVIFMLPVSVAAWKDAPEADNNKQKAVIIEVDGNPEKRKTYLETYHPYINIVAVYDKLFNGIALKAKPQQLAKLGSLDFITAVHQVTTYKTQTDQEADTMTNLDDGITEDSVLPSELNNTNYTGKGVQVAIIDTGIDYNHPDLAANFAGGYDLVDLDDDPMETLPSEGMPTQHGSHVAGIIAANGALQGVAPDADIYSYRGLGPGGMGTSIQIIAALERAVEDGADVINLSLGNSINGPDFPTSVAVNRAVALGVPVVIANGNSGPDKWTIGSPATAKNALSVGAAAYPQTQPYLEETRHDKKINLELMRGSVPWNLQKDYGIQVFKSGDVRGKIALIKRGKTPFSDLAKQAENAGAKAVLIYNNKSGMFRGMVGNAKDPITIPVASITKQDGEWLRKQAESDSLYMDTSYMQTQKKIAAFSSRGPVTVNWDLKPGISAPGTNILSTVPGGYQHLQGTSMAAPHVTGVMALLMEAHPDWDIAQLTGAVKTTAKQINKTNGQAYAPIIQGAGEIQPKQAIRTNTIIDNPLLSFGKITSFHETNKKQITIENTSESKQTYSFQLPKNKHGVNWRLPKSVTLLPGESKRLPIELSINSKMLEKGIHQGWLRLNSANKQYKLPYLFVNKTADNPKVMGFDLGLKPFSEDTYTYQFYLTDPAERVEVDLYSMETLVYERTLLTKEDTATGMNKGTLQRSELGKPGTYRAVIRVKLKSGRVESYQTKLHIPIQP
ncbi:S8 family serine peptidase [Lentibacillus cibarius]|uniref:Peptidase S8 n=1 Tax=Lentibacillus cibarius TaxID=2583219 RepID=A0A5S3QJJ1_9BACI|nr:S8 family serine peptidase [Lentibacillus cibarius]TMN21998.1 peptidase S8 [Lentibacillus cibarius]